MAEQPIYHRSPEFRALHDRVRKACQKVFQASGQVVVLASSGTGGMESILVSLTSPGDGIIAVNGGKFGARWAEMGRRFGLSVQEITIPWGEAVSPERLADGLRRAPRTQAVCLTHCETSTGTVTDVRSCAEAIRACSDALICIDGVSSVGGLELRFDEWGIDACVAGSQKALMVPPGLAVVALSERAVGATARATMPRFALDLGRAVASAATGDTPWTPASTLLAGLDVALEMLNQEGIERVWARHRRLGAGVRAGVRALGLELFSHFPSDAVTAAWLPREVSWDALRDALRSRCGVTFAGGQGEFSGRIIRISHLGYVDGYDVLAALAALEEALGACGFTVNRGAGVAAAHDAMLESGTDRRV